MTMSECEDEQIGQMVVGNVCFVVYYADLKSSSTIGKAKKKQMWKPEDCPRRPEKVNITFKIVLKKKKNPPHPCTNLPVSEKNTAW